MTIPSRIGLAILSVMLGATLVPTHAQQPPTYPIQPKFIRVGDFVRYNVTQRNEQISDEARGRLARANAKIRTAPVKWASAPLKTSVQSTSVKLVKIIPESNQTSPVRNARGPKQLIIEFNCSPNNRPATSITSELENTIQKFAKEVQTRSNTTTMKASAKVYGVDASFEQVVKNEFVQENSLTETSREKEIKVVSPFVLPATTVTVESIQLDNISTIKTVKGFAVVDANLYAKLTQPVYNNRLFREHNKFYVGKWSDYEPEDVRRLPVSVEFPMTSTHLVRFHDERQFDSPSDCRAVQQDYDTSSDREEFIRTIIFGGTPSIEAGRSDNRGAATSAFEMKSTGRRLGSSVMALSHTIRPSSDDKSCHAIASATATLGASGVLLEFSVSIPDSPDDVVSGGVITYKIRGLDAEGRPSIVDNLQSTWTSRTGKTFKYSDTALKAGVFSRVDEVIDEAVTFCQRA